MKSNIINQAPQENLRVEELALLAANLSRRQGTNLTVRQRAERLYLMGELQAAAELLAEEIVQ
jgi:hypothetical protein